MSVPHSVEPESGTGERRTSLRAARFNSLAVLWDLSTLGRVRGCRRVGVLADGSALLRVTGTGAERRAGFGGLATCGSTWACPCCAERIAAGREEELTAAIEAWRSAGNAVAMVTLTMRHDRGQALSSLWDAVSRAWGAVTSGRGWEGAHVRYGAVVSRTLVQGARKGTVVLAPFVGWTRVVEVTHGKNGWHVHVHSLLFLRRHVSARDVRDLGAEMFQRWRARLVADGFAAPLSHLGGLDARLAGDGAGGLGKYLTKSRYGAGTAEGTAAEITRGASKAGLSGNRTPFAILADIVAAPVSGDVALWHEWEAASAGRRQMTWSQGWREMLVPTVEEKTDHELAAEDLGGEDLLGLPRATVRAIGARRLHAALLDAAESDDSGDWARLFLVSHGLEFTAPPTVGDAAVRVLDARLVAVRY